MSVWSDIGIRKGEFFAVNPTLFLATVFQFFTETREVLYREWQFGASYPHEWRKSISFNWCSKRDEIYTSGGHGGVFAENMLGLNIDLNSGPPLHDFTSLFMPPDTWCARPGDVWDMPLFREDKDVFGDMLILHPLQQAQSGDAFLADDIKWQHQRYELIQRLRFLVIPMAIYVKWTKDADWEAYSDGMLGEVFNIFDGVWGIKAVVADYWARDGVSFKIGVRSEGDFPVVGNFWHNGKEFVFDNGENIGRFNSYINIFAVVDLATHPDFEKYYDSPEIIECPSLPGPESYPESSSSSSSIVLPSESQSFTSPSSPSPSSSGGGGGGGCTLKEAYFRLNSKRRTVGAVFSYTSVEVGEGPDTYLDYYAVSWNGYKGTKLYESISADVFNAACDTWLPVGVSLDVLRNGMQEAAQDIYATNVNAPWQDGGIYVDGATRVSGNDKADFTISGKKEYTISQWAFTANPLSNNTSNPAQCFGELMLVSTNDGITSVDVKIGDKVFTMAVGDTLGWDELKEFFQYGNLPKPELGDCYPDFVEPSERILWPLLYNVNNATYPWGNMGESQSLKIEIVGYICEKAKSVVANTATETNAYTNALPEDLK